MGFSTLRWALAVAGAAILTAEEVHAEFSAAALDADDECEAGVSSEDCALRAVQLRAHRMKAEEAAKASASTDTEKAVPAWCQYVPDAFKNEACRGSSSGGCLCKSFCADSGEPAEAQKNNPECCGCGADGKSAGADGKKAGLTEAEATVESLAGEEKPPPKLPDMPSSDDDDDEETDDDDEEDSEDDDEEEGKDDDDDDDDKKASKSTSSGSSKSGPKVAKAYGQCGGAKWKGATSCPDKFDCAKVDKYYSQCWPAGSEPPKRKPQKHQEQEQDEDDDGIQEPLAEQDPLPEAPTVSDLSPIVIKGNFLYNSKTGDRFFAKGVAYNPRNLAFNKVEMKGGGNCTGGHPELPRLAYDADPTADDLEDLWGPALNAMADLGANTVRLYNIDPEISHKKFMDKAKSLGIYVIIPLTRHDWGFLPAGSPSPACYEEVLDDYGNVGTNLLTSAKLIVKQFSQYDNTLLFTVANEMTVADKNGYAAFPCVKALTRDIHTYQSNCSDSMRRVPLIYADMDMGPPYRELVGRYLTCELESPEDAVDAYGLNVYSWCDSEYPDGTGENNFKYSPYYPIKEEFEHFPKPLIFTEFGCNVGEFETQCPYKGGRTWPDVKTFFTQFSEIMSGAVAFEFSMESNEYGITMTPGYTSDPNNKDKIYYLDSYFALKKEFNKYNVSTKWNGAKITDCDWVPSDAHKMSYSRKASKCPSKDSVEKLFEDKGLDVKANWGSLPPLPPGADQDKLAHCAKDDVAPAIKKEGCCHMQC